ncbi:bifunctional precorrin-2 dehydrogenase/sirohydrochlorin ferrochelatase [uncultured Fusobacterium sp.]|uniref:precorrin-2 dehydrogenase/sirohydrochlorin ferrochelatase family protein n=1 Tax=uncultured Fusobacterium sp. TaxID=159267 RepID=UPI0015A536C6|nr:bifunctional precorrin-2 dehydrogenase/sirohydrochlorin ferrochelatase [uncultured Fusobacterium sp.]
MNKKNFFPIFVDLSDKNILIIGAGKVAFRKISTLLETGAYITVFAKQIKEKEITKLLFDKPNIQLIMKEVDEKSLDEIITNKYVLVIAGTDDKELNSAIVKCCNKKNILVNNITSTDDMSARFCSVIDEKDYSIGISAKGDPKKSLALKEKISDFLSNKR